MIIRRIFQQRRVLGTKRWYHLQVITSGKVPWLTPLCLFYFVSMCFAIGQDRYVDRTFSRGSFCLANKDELAALYVDLNDYAGVVRAAKDLQADINRVTDRIPALTYDETAPGKNVVIIGAIGKSQVIDRLIHDGKVDASQITGKWESFLIQVVPEPLPGVENGLIIAGSDKRGTIYGIYDLSEQIGVSPWYWWADVPVEHKDALFIKPGKYVQGPPAVKYRGIFLNDEGWALTPWVKEKFGDYNSKFYTKVFELLLRLKANYLWPAMWSNAFNEDDPNNPRLADEYGIVMGNSHQEPMLRAQKEWDRRYSKKWDYYTDANTLQNFWREGIRRNKNYESIISIGLRGPDDTPLVLNGTVAQCMAFLEEIVANQRKIIAEEINPDATKVPQLWCPYKEAQEYYEKGLRVPDDVTILWCDDNWGNLRRLPTAEERKRSGGAGIYYHFDFHGGPRSYEWLNTIQIAKIQEQMNLAYNYGATKIWIVNVGDLKPMEFPIEFFMTFAWDPQRWPKEKISEFTRLWAEREFGPKYAADITDIVSKYTKYNARRKPELIEPTTYSLVNYHEADTVSADFNAIAAKAEQIYTKLPDNAKDAFYQLVLYPTKACAQVTELYITAGKNKLYAEQKRASTNDLAAQARGLFKADAEMSKYYNKTMANGKWNHIMDTTHIGYTSWNPPPKNNMPKVEEIDVPADANMGVAVEGLRSAWPGSSDEPVLPGFSVFGEQRRYINVFNRGQTPFEFSAKPSADWIMLSSTKGTIDKEQRIWVNIDWSKVPVGDANGSVKISGPGAKELNIKINSSNPTEPNKDSLEGFVEANGYVSIEAEHYTKKVDAGEVHWDKIDDYGRTLSSMTIFPVTAQSVTPPKDSPCLEYKMFLFHPGNIKVEAIFAPTLNFVPDRDLRYAVSFDDQPPQIISIVSKDYIVAYSNNDWQESVRNSARTVKSTHMLADAGHHTLKVWMVDPGVVLQKIIVNTGGVKPSYLGPPESYRGGKSIPSSNGPVGSNAGVAETNANGSGAFAAGHYRNLFVEVGHSPQEVAAKINGAFRQFFHGDPCTQAIYFPAGTNANGPLAYICDIHHNDVRSEGMSYGMMVAVQLDKKAEFDALWNWAKTCMYHDSPNHPAYGFFSWQMKTTGEPIDEMPAPDGEEYFVMSLYFASGRWGNGKGIYNYRAQADRLLNDMKNRQPITGQTVKGPTTAGNLFDSEHKMVRFSPVTEIRDHTDPSYHLPAFYELWALWGPPAERIFWEQAAAVSRDFFQKTTHPATGLSPEYANFDGSPWDKEQNSYSVHFRADAWRTAMNWAVDWAWWAKDVRERQLSDHIQAFFEAKNISHYASQFTLDGNSLGGKHLTGLVATNAVAGLATTHPRAKLFVEDLWKASVPAGRLRYYDGTLYMLAMLHCSGQFRIWPPQ
jgi:endo-1,4-beta-D-glucanase Y